MSRLSFRPRPLDIYKKLSIVKSVKDLDGDDIARTCLAAALVWMLTMSWCSQPLQQGKEVDLRFPLPNFWWWIHTSKTTLARFLSPLPTFGAMEVGLGFAIAFLLFLLTLCL